MTRSEQLRARFKALGASRIAPRSLAHDELHQLDREAWAAVAEEGLFRLAIPRSRGGDGGDLSELNAAIHGLALGSLDLGFAIAAVAHMCCTATFARFGQDPAWARHGEALMSGRAIGAVANAEPRAGTDITALRTRAMKTTRGWILDGRKRSITNVGAAELILCSARVTDAPPKRAINVFLVSTADSGVLSRSIDDLMGLRTSPTGSLLLRHAQTSDDALLGGLGAGIEIFRYVFSLERLLTASLYLAALDSCQQRALDHLAKRQLEGRSLSQHQYIQDHVVGMHVSSVLLAPAIDRAIEAFERGDDVFGALSALKVFGVDAALTASQRLVRLLGSRGFTKAEPAERMVRDLLGLSILGGTVELQKMVIFRALTEAAETGRTIAEATQDIAIERYDGELEAGIARELVELTQIAFPHTPALFGRYYYDTRPDSVLAARIDSRLVGFRVLVRREVTVSGRSVRVAGTGIAVHPAHRGRGIARILTEQAISRVREEGAEIMIAFLFEETSNRLLTSFGFRRLTVRLTYQDRQTGEIREEKMPCYAKVLTCSSLLEEIDAMGSLHLGTGIW
jgi:isovaleryl-CoA dehydrogenase